MLMPPEPTETADFQPCPQGSHVAVCFLLVALGRQVSRYADQVKNQFKILLGWQVPAERTEDGKPQVVYARLTLSSSPKSTLRKYLESWRGKRFEPGEIDQFDLRKVLGASCIITVAHSHRDSKVFADVNGVAAMPKGSQKATIEGDKVYLSLDHENFEPAIFESLSEKLRATIAKSPEFQSLEYAQPSNAPTRGQQATTDQSTDDIPF